MTSSSSRQGCAEEWLKPARMLRNSVVVVEENDSYSIFADSCAAFISKTMMNTRLRYY